MTHLARAVLLIDGKVRIGVVVSFVDVLLRKGGQRNAEKCRYSNELRRGSRNGRIGQSNSLSFTSVKAAIRGK